MWESIKNNKKKMAEKKCVEAHIWSKRDFNQGLSN